MIFYIIVILQKIKNSIKSDLLEKCPKCEEQDCDCIIKEEVEPMVIMSHPDSHKDVNSSVAMFTVPATLNDKIYRSISPSATMTQMDKVDETKT